MNLRSSARAVAPLLFVIACRAAPPVTVPPPAPSRPAAVVRVRLTPTDVLQRATPNVVGMDAALTPTLDSLAAQGIRETAAPGMSIAVGRYGRLVQLRGYGATDWQPGSTPVSDSTLYDLASLTKVIATTTAAMILEEEGRLDISRPVSSYVPELNAPDKAAITVRELLTHSGGLEAGANLYTRAHGRAEYLAQINSRPLRYAPGTQMIYSDWDMVLLQAVIERITGQPLDQFVGARVFGPLGMRDTRFNPDTLDTALRARIAPTAIDTTRGGLLHGVVHDANAWAIGGVSGHAGLFSSARDLAVFAAMLLNGGEYSGVRILHPETIARWTTRQSGMSSRALGWDTPTPNSSSGHYFSPHSFGHTGFTGTSLWIDPERGLFVVLLMNRVNSRGVSERHVQLRRDVADAVQSSIVDAPLIDWEATLRAPPNRTP